MKHRTGIASVKMKFCTFMMAIAMKVQTSSDGQKIKDVTLGKDLAEGQRYHWVVPAHTWFSMQSMGEWSLIGCTVSPAFTFDDFELARPGWSPGDNLC